MQLAGTSMYWACREDWRKLPGRLRKVLIRSGISFLMWRLNSPKARLDLMTAYTDWNL